VGLAIKIVVGLIVVVVAGYLAIVAGLFFELWPTDSNDHSLTIAPETIAQLQLLHDRRKFVTEADTLYGGAPTEQIRFQAEAPLNRLLERLISDLPQNPRKSFVLQCFKDTLREFNGFDTEEQERMLKYLEEIMDIVGVESSERLLTVWRYRFPL